MILLSNHIINQDGRKKGRKEDSKYRKKKKGIERWEVREKES